MEKGIKSVKGLPIKYADSMLTSFGSDGKTEILLFLKFRYINFDISDNGEISDILLFSANKATNSVIPDNGEMSVIWLLFRNKFSILVNPDNGVISEILFFVKSNIVTFGGITPLSTISASF